MTHPYKIERRGYGCAAFYNGHRLDVSGTNSRETRVAMAGLLAEHYRLGSFDLEALRLGRDGGPSVARVRRLAGDLADAVQARPETFHLDQSELDQLLALQVRCWMPGDLVWIPHEHAAHGWIAGNVQEVRIDSAGTTIFVEAGTDSGLRISGRCKPEQLRHRSKGGQAPWKR